MSDGDATTLLLQRWHAGERDALDALLERELAWIRAFVAQRTGQLLGHKGDVDDYVHDAILKVLDYAPRFPIADQRQFRALLGKICENTLRDRVAEHRAKKRDVGKEREIPSDTALAEDPTAREVTHVSSAVGRHADETWLRLAVEMLEPDARRLILLRHWEHVSFPAIAKLLDVSEDAARMRYKRVLPRLAIRVEELRRSHAADPLQVVPLAAVADRDAPEDEPGIGADGCWELLEAVARDAGDARERYRRLSAAIYVPAARRWFGAVVPAAEFDAAVDAVVAACVPAGGLPPAARAQGFRRYLHAVLERIAGRIEGRIEGRIAACSDRADVDAVSASAFESAWARTLIDESGRMLAVAAAGDEERRFRVELLDLHYRQGVPLTQLSRRWGIDAETVTREYTAARDEFTEQLRALVRFHEPEHSRVEIEAETRRVLAVVASEDVHDAG